MVCSGIAILTTIGILSGVVSGAALGDRLALTLIDLGLPKGWADTLGYTLVIGVISGGTATALLLPRGDQEPTNE